MSVIDYLPLCLLLYFVVSSDPVFNIDPGFIEFCRQFKEEGNSSSILPNPSTSTLTAANPISVADGGRLTNKYPYAWTDFYPSRAPCVYKSGPVWDVRRGPEEQAFIREPRPVYRPDMAPCWPSTLQRVIGCLNDMGVQFTCITPSGWANQGEAELLCPFLLSIGVTPHSLSYDGAVAASSPVKEILASCGLPEAEVAFVEMSNKRQAGPPKFLPLDPIKDIVPEHRKPFSSALGLPIARLSSPYCEGTGALYFRLGGDSKSVALLTCAHVVHPPPPSSYSRCTQYSNTIQPEDRMMALGAAGYSRVVLDMVNQIAKHTDNVDVWNRYLKQDLPASRCDEITRAVDGAKSSIKALSVLHSEVTRYRSIHETRSIGWTLYSSPVQSSVQPLGYTEDWGFIRVYPSIIDEKTFLGNKVFVGTFILQSHPIPLNASSCCHTELWLIVIPFPSHPSSGGKFTPAELAKLLYPHSQDRAHNQVLDNSLLQARGVVSAVEISNPTHLDVNGRACLVALKNGGTTGTTIGRVNGLESVKRTVSEDGLIEHDSLSIAVLSYGEGHGIFTDVGDSGSIVLTREGNILGMVTGGAGSADGTDVTWITPFWWLQEQIKKQFPHASLYDNI